MESAASRRRMMGRERVQRHRAQLTPEQLASQCLTNLQAMRVNRALKSAKQRAANCECSKNGNPASKSNSRTTFNSTL
jgi:hypothetical protein